MELQFTPWILPALISAVSAALALVWFRKLPDTDEPSLLTLKAMFVGVLIWSIGNVIEHLSTSVAGKLLGTQIAYPGIVLVPVAWFLWICAYTSRLQWLFPGRWRWLLILPGLAILLAWTNSFHDLMWVSPELVATPGFIAWKSVHGTGWLLATAYSYAMMISALILTINTMAIEPWSRRHLIILALLMVLPLTPSMLFIAGLIPPAVPIDITSATFTGVLIWLVWLARDPLTRLLPASKSLIIESITSPIAVLDENGHLVYRNLAAKRLMESANITSDFVSRQFGPSNDSPQDIPPFEVSTTKGSLYLEARRSIVLDTNNRLSGYIMLVADRTEERALATGLERAITIQQGKTRSLEADRRERSKFGANVTHELRSPLGSIVGFSELLKDNLVDPLEAAEILQAQRIYDVSNRLLQHVNQVLDLEKVQSGSFALKPDVIDLTSVCDLLEAEVASWPELAGTDIVIHYDATQCSITLDTARTVQIICNLLVHLVAISPDSSFKVHLSLVDAHLAVELVQEGPHIDLPDEAMLAEATFDDVQHYAQARSTKLGLALVRRLIDLHGGSLSFERTGNHSLVTKLLLSALPTVQP